MFEFINQHSLVIGGVVLLVIVGIVLFRDGAKPGDFAIIGVMLAVMVGGWIVIRPTPTAVSEADKIRARIGQGVPVLLEFQSPF
jgi:hypothetical protein